MTAPPKTAAALSLTLALWLSGLAALAFGTSAYVTLASLERRAVLATAAMALLVGAVSFVLVRHLVDLPLRRVTRATRRAAGGDLDTSIDGTLPADFRALAAAVGQMRDELRQASRESHRWPQELEKKVADKTEELARAHRQMAHMERLASLGRLAGAVAHEVNNPLSAMLMYARLVERELPGSGFPPEKREEIVRFLRQIQTDAARCGDVVRNLLLFARTPGGDFALLHTNHLIERSLALVRHRLEMARIRLDVHPLAQDVAIACDANQLQQALVSLLVNAADAMPHGGRLTVRAERTGARVRIDITDTGVAIGPDVLPHAFEPFLSDNAEDDGARPGLAVVYGIVQRHGGTIEVESEADCGTTFRINLPLAASGPAATNA